MAAGPKRRPPTAHNQNSTGTSAAVSATLQSLQPAFFTASNYIAAVRSDGVIIGGSQAAQPGDVLQLYATGFGPTSPSIAPGVVFTGSYPLTGTVTITIGGVTAPVAYAGLVAAGLYQLNITVPALAAGDHEVIAQIEGVLTQSGVLLKVSA